MIGCSKLDTWFWCKAFKDTAHAPNKSADVSVFTLHTRPSLPPSVPACPYLATSAPLGHATGGRGMMGNGGGRGSGRSSRMH